MTDYLVKTTAYNNNVRAYAAISTETVKEAQRRQDSWPTASAALGRSITITAMMGAMLKGDHSLNVKVEGNGPAGAIVSDADAKGNVRGYMKHPHVDFPLNDGGKLDVARAVGTEGSLRVVKDLGLKDYFTGEVPIVSGEIGEDFTYYYAHSEQTPSAVGAGVLVNPDHSVLASGGFIIQLMPHADEDVVKRLEEQIQAFPPISTLIREGKSPEKILEALFGDEEVTVLEKIPLAFQCKCSRDRVENAITGLGIEEIDKMINEDHGAEATCHFCNQVYTFSEQDLNKLKQAIQE